MTDWLEIHTEMRDYTIQVMGLDGKVVLTSELNDSGVDMRGLSFGTYLVTIRNETASVVKKINKW